jgi:hypothetical protein
LQCIIINTSEVNGGHVCHSDTSLATLFAE